MYPSLIRVRLCLETIYLFSIQFILNKFSSSHFMTFKFFVKISSLESLATYHLKNRKNIPTISEFDETFLGHWISQDESSGSIYFVIQDIKNFLSFPEPIWQILLFFLFFFHFFLKITKFPKFYKTNELNKPLKMQCNFHNSSIKKSH